MKSAERQRTNEENCEQTENNLRKVMRKMRNVMKINEHSCKKTEAKFEEKRGKL